MHAKIRKPVGPVAPAHPSYTILGGGAVIERQAADAPVPPALYAGQRLSG